MAYSTGALRMGSSLLAISFLFASASAYAQSAPSSAPTPAAGQVAESDSADTQDIVVTAQRREERLQNVPINISALSGEQLRARGVGSTEDLGKITPGVLVSQFGGVPSILTINIRGVAQLDYADHQEAPNTVYLDGAYISFPGASGFGLFDVARVEVLSGPQGTLFGRNATGGLIQVISERPSQTTSGYLQAQYGTYNQVRFEGAVGGALSNTLSGRISASFNRQDGWIKNTLGANAGEDKTFSGRVQLLWKPSSNFEDLLSVYGSRTPRVGAGLYDIFSTAPDPANGGLPVRTNGPLFNDLCNALGFGTPPAGSTTCTGYVKRPGRELEADSVPGGYFERSIIGATNTATLNLGGVTLNSITNYLHIDKYYQERPDSSPVVLFKYNSAQKAYQISQELRLNGSSERFRWQFGGYFLHVDGDYGIGSDLSGSYGIIGGLNFSQKTTSYSIFGQGEYDILPRLTFTLGARWTRDEKQFLSAAVCNLTPANCSANGFSPNGTRFDGDITNEGWSGKAQLSYKASDDVLIYAGVNRGIKGALILALAPPAPGTVFSDLIIKPEVLTDYEGGVKTSLLNRRVTLNANIFYYDYHNYQAFKSVGSAGILFNADARMYGGEVQFSARLGSGFSTSLTGAVLDTKVYNVQIPDGSFRNMQAPFAPKLSANGNLRKEFATSSGTFFVQGDVSYVGSRYFSTVNSAAVFDSSYVLGSLSAGYTTPDEHWSVIGKIDNIGDNRYTISVFDDTILGGFSNQNFGRPRTASLQVRYKF